MGEFTGESWGGPKIEYLRRDGELIGARRKTLMDPVNEVLRAVNQGALSRVGRYVDWIDGLGSRPTNVVTIDGEPVRTDGFVRRHQALIGRTIAVLVIGGTFAAYWPGISDRLERERELEAQADARSREAVDRIIAGLAVPQPKSDSVGAPTAIEDVVTIGPELAKNLRFMDALKRSGARVNEDPNIVIAVVGEGVRGRVTLDQTDESNVALLTKKELVVYGTILTVTEVGTNGKKTTRQVLRTTVGGIGVLFSLKDTDGNLLVTIHKDPNKNDKRI